ncbi:MAG: hypothetical protein SF123_07310 [Chloroflexota bacterium]|nr:hypothetical protein [Chloroflexota bacterium]
MMKNSAQPCPRCQIGHLQRGQATFTAVYQNTLLSVPNVADWSCDICQYHEFDYDVLRQVELVTGALPVTPDTARQTARGAAHESGDTVKSQRLKP